MLLLRRNGKSGGAEEPGVVFEGGGADGRRGETLVPEDLGVRKGGDAFEVFRLLVREPTPDEHTFRVEHVHKVGDPLRHIAEVPLYHSGGNLVPRAGTVKGGPPGDVLTADGGGYCALPTDKGGVGLAFQCRDGSIGFPAAVSAAGTLYPAGTDAEVSPPHSR